MSEIEGELPGASPGGPNSAWDFREELPETMTHERRREREGRQLRSYET